MATSDEIVKSVRDRSPPCAKVGVFDVDGIFRGKYMGADKLASALANGFGFCDVVLGWDMSDQLYDNVAFTGWHSAYPDAEVRLLPETLRTIPFEGGTPLILGEFSGRAEAVCPRGLLRRILDRAAAAGYRVNAAVEYEFFLFEETPQSVRDKGYRGLKPITPGNFGYSMLRSGVHADFYEELWTTCESMRIELEALHTETGPGVIEAAIRVDDALEAADKAALFKTIVKILAQRRGWMATFMAKWSRDWPGQSGHLHMSLIDSESGRSAFHEEGAEHSMSERMRWFVGGQQALMPELLAMAAPTVNSFTRLIPGFWAPTAATWGFENRTCALRVIGGSAACQRVEYRIAAADINPYVALAAAIGSGLWGIERRIDPDPAIAGNAYALDAAPERGLPSTLWEAAQRLRGSAAAGDLFGDEFVDHYAATREWEEREARKAVTDWQLARYFEII
jgi:glutamine synthetase